MSRTWGNRYTADPARTDQGARRVQILRALTRKWWSLCELARAHEVSESMIRLDLKEIRAQGYPVERRPERTLSRGRKEPARYRLPEGIEIPEPITEKRIVGPAPYHACQAGV